MITDEHKAAIRELYLKVADSIPGFKKRLGQREMVGHAARTLGSSCEGQADGANFLVVEGRTGVGKTVGYLVPALIMGPALQKKVVLSTGTVALQEQLFGRDLPAVLSCMDKPPSIALLKGRGRFACLSRLHQMSGSAGQESLFGDATWDRRPEEKEIHWLRKVGQELVDEKWNGELDTLSSPPPGDVWGRIANNRHTCVGRKCDNYRSCPYFKSLDAVRAADVIVANHDLVLACISAESKLLPAPAETFYVFDEAHHLPTVAVNRFAMEMSTGARRWIERIPNAYSRLFAAIHSLPGHKAIADLSRLMTESLSELEAALRHNSVLQQKGVFRFAQGQLDPQFESVALRLYSTANDLTEALESVHEALEEEAKGGSTLSTTIQSGLVDADFALARISHLKASLELFAKKSDDQEPLAKWVSLDGSKGGGYNLNASPILAGPILRDLVWSNAAGAVLTSATLTSLGNFEFFLADTGLDGFSQTVSVAVASPFDYAAQGEIVIPRMKSDPANANDHTDEITALLPAHLDAVTSGALMLFASRKQMQAVHDALPVHLKSDALMQGDISRAQLLAAHIERVRSGKRSILFGLSSFGEGLDLPGALCQSVFIAKIPFSPPDSPIEEARSEWIESRGGNPFMEVTLPKAGLTLIQWAGRLIRTESDTGRVVLFDTRIRTKRYGRSLLDGLPPFRRVAA